MNTTAFKAIFAGILSCFIIYPEHIRAQEPGTIPWTPKSSGDLRAATISVPSKYSSIALDPSVHKVNVPEGWTASVFFAGSRLGKPRFMSWGPDSVLFVANMNAGNVLALPDVNRDGIADTMIVAAGGFSYGHDVRFWGDTMYVCQEAGIVKLWRSDKSSYVFNNRVTVVDKSSQPNQTGGNHRTRTLVVDTLRRKFVVSVGSRGNADRELNRAIIEEYEFDGSGRHTVATGVRNAVGLTLHPRTGAIWANNNGSDNQGNDVPPEWVDIVRDGGFYGYPYAYHYQRYFTFTGDYQDLLPITRADSMLVQSMVPPAALVTSHCAPMALVFTDFTPIEEHRYGAFMAMRGSWNRNPLSGAKIVFLEFDNDADTIANVVRDFCTGFINDTTNVATRWGRPVGLAVSADGSVFVSVDEGKQMILKLTPPKGVASVRGTTEVQPVVYPNPANENITIECGPSLGRIRMVSALGNVVIDVPLEHRSVTIDTRNLPSGMYTLHVPGYSAPTNVVVVH